MIKTPKENIAEDEVSLVQDAQTRIKEIILADLVAGIDSKSTRAKIQVVINETLEKTKLDKKVVEQSLETLAKNNYYQVSKSINKLAISFVKE